MKIVSLQDTKINSNTGFIKFATFEEINLKSNSKIVFDSRKVDLKSVPKSRMLRHSSDSTQAVEPNKGLQVQYQLNSIHNKLINIIIY